MKFNATKLNFSLTEIVDQKLSFVLKKGRGVIAVEMYLFYFRAFRGNGGKGVWLQELYIRLNVSLNYSKNE